MYRWVNRVRRLLPCIRPPLPLGTEEGGPRVVRFPKADDQPRFAVGLLHCSIFSTRHDVVPVA